MNENLLKILKKELGDDVIVSGRDVLNREDKIIPVGPALDVALGGGIPQGSMVLCGGKPKCGKTILSLWFARQCQQAGMHVVYNSVEHRLNKREFNITDLNPDNITVIESTVRNAIAAEKFLASVIKTIQMQPNTLIIVDSLSALVPEKDLNSEIKVEHRHGVPKLLAQFCREVATILRSQECILWMNQHVIANTDGSPWSPKTMEDGGNKVQYQADIKLKGISSKDWLIDGKNIGKNNTWKVLFSPLGSPNLDAECWFRFNHGIDVVLELIEVCIPLGIIRQNGAWYSITDENKFQGKENLYKFLVNKDNENILQELMKNLYSMLF